MEMECSGGSSVPDEYECDTDEEDSLSKSEVLPKNKAGNENIDRMDDELPDSSKTANRQQLVDGMNSSTRSSRKRPRKSSVPKRLIEASTSEKLADNVTKSNIKTEIETGEASDNDVDDEMYIIDTDIESNDSDQESDKTYEDKVNVSKKYKSKKRYVSRDHGVDFPEPVIIDSLDGGKPVKVLKCELCNKACKSKASYVAHYKVCSDPTTTPEGKLVCEICSQVYGTRRNLNRHLKMHYGDDRLKCNVCGRQFTEMKSLKGHLMIHTGEKPYPCSVCGLRFRDQSTRRKHECRHSDEKPFSCEHCGKAFAQGVDLRKHLKIHDAYEDREFRCDQCDKAYYLVAQLKRHLRTHTGEKPYECQYCGKFFCDQANLRKHTSTHDAACLKKFQCDVCGDTFLFQCRLDVHMRRHDNIRNFKCDICNRCFFTASNLSKHKTTHEPKENVINLKCYRCEKVFGDIDALKQHRKTHKSIKREQCAFCGKRYATAWVLNRHIGVCKGKKYIENGISRVNADLHDKTCNENSKTGMENRKLFQNTNYRTVVKYRKDDISENQVEVLIGEQPDVPINDLMTNYGSIVNTFSHT